MRILILIVFAIFFVGPAMAQVCSTDADCSDGVWCNGREICSPASSGADARGCMRGSLPTCVSSGLTCNEATNQCNAQCDVAMDADGDGSTALACGGDDCDDGDPNRYPGNFEVCDAMGHDEDCNPNTFGNRDNDGDGYVDMFCAFPRAGQ